MDRMTKFLHAIGGVFSGVLCYVFGEFDTAMKILCAMVVFDFVMGLAKGIVLNTLDSRKCFVGIARKVALFAMVGVSHLLQTWLGGSVPLREIAITFYLINELVSIFENAGLLGIPFPPQLMDVFEQLKIGKGTPKEKEKEKDVD